MVSDDTTFTPKSYEDSILGDFELFVDENRSPMVDVIDASERERLAILGLVAATGGLAELSLSPVGDAAVHTELMVQNLGDVLYYLTTVCSAFGTPLDCIMDTAIEDHLRNGSTNGNN